MARSLGNAWVGISPNLQGFSAGQVGAKIKTALGGVSPTIPVNANTKPAVASVVDLKAKMDALSRRAVDLRANLQDKGAIAKITALDARITRLGQKVASPKIDLAGQQSALAGILAVDLAMDKLSKKVATPTVTVRQRTSLLGKLGGIFGGGGSPGGGGLLGGVLGGGQAAGGAAGSGGPVGIVAGITASLVALPFIAQAAAGGIVLALGGTLAGLGIAGALGGGGGKAATPAQLASARGSVASAQDALNKANASRKSTPLQRTAAQDRLTAAQDRLTTLQSQGGTGPNPAQKAFANLKKSATADLRSIGVSFVPVMTSIFNTATGVLGKLTPVFAAATTVISGPFKQFSDAFISAFNQPSVKQSIHDVASSFAILLTAVTPQVAGDFAQVATAISNVAKAVAANPKAFTGFVRFLTNVVSGSLNVIAALTGVASWIERHWKDIGPTVEGPFIDAFALVKGLIDVFTGNWSDLWKQVRRIFVSTVAGFAGIWKLIIPRGIRHEIAVIFDGVRHDTANITALTLRDIRRGWNDIFGATVGVAIRIGHNVETQFDELRHRTASTFDHIRHDVATAMNNTYGATIGVAIRLGHNVEAQFDELRHRVASTFDHARHDIASAWNRVYSDTVGTAIRLVGTVTGRLRAFFTGTLPGWFNTAVSKIGQFWGKLGGIVQAPVKWVFQHVIDPLAGGFDAVTNALGLGRPIPAHVVRGWARGGSPGKIFAGTSPTADDVLARVSKGETVVSAAHSKVLAPAFAALGVPGYAGGGIPIVGGLAGGLPGIIGSALKGTLNGIIPGLGSLLGAAGSAIQIPAVQNVLGKILARGTDGAGGSVKDVLAAMGSRAVADMVGWLKGRQAAGSGGFGGGQLGPVTPGGSAGVRQEQAYAASLLAQYGWGGDQMRSLIALWNQESGWNPWAANPTSNARGIPQSIQGWSSYAPGDWKNQIIWGLNYIRSRYGSPDAAEAHESIFNWYSKGGLVGRIAGDRASDLGTMGHPGSRAYLASRYGAMGLLGALQHESSYGFFGGGGRVFDNGGTLAPGANLVFNRTGRPEHVTPDSGGVHVTLEFSNSGSDFDQLMMAWIRQKVRIKGGGSVQVAFGRR